MNINMPTSLAGGRYQLGQLVGRGGMAEVHVATDTRLGRTVAVKIMRADFATDSIFLERFRREAHSVAQMNNPNIVNIYDSGEEAVTTETGEVEHLPYLVMEYVKGQTLRDILKVNGALSQRDAEQVMMGVLNALEYSHRMGIIHRDIKPGNIMISEQGVVKVMDFGIVPGLPKMWDSICAKAMAKDRQNRYATASEFKNDLMTFMNGGVPMAAAFNPLTDLTNMKARKQAEMDANTVAMTPATETTATQAFNPVTGQFEAVPNQNAALATKTRAEQRAKEAQERKKKKIIIASVVGGIVAVLAIIGIVFMLNSHKNAEDTVSVPDFTTTSNISEARVEEQLKALDLKLDAREDTTSSQPKGTITKQNPKGGKKVTKGSTVTVWFSTGPQSVSVPDVSKHTQEEAKEILEAAGFKVGNVTTIDSATVAKDRVVKTNPAARSKQTKGTIISLYISSGLTQIPSLVGQPKDTAIERLKEASFTQITIESESSDTVAEGSVTRIDPGEGSTVEAGSPVTIWVSTGRQQVNVPNVVGMGCVDAKALLESVGLKVSVSGPADGLVTGMSPNGGSKADAGTTITLTTKSQSTGSDDDDNNNNGDDNDNGNGNNNQQQQQQNSNGN